VTPSSFASVTADTAAVITKTAVSGAIAITAGLPQDRQDLIPPGQRPRQPAEMLIDLLLDRRINADFVGQIGNDTNQLLGVGHQGNIAFAEALQCLDLATLAQPNLVVGRDRGTPELGIDLEDPLGDGTEVPRRGQMFRIRVGVRAGWRWQVFPPIASFE